MKSRGSKLLLLLIILLCPFFLGCETVITEGQYRGLEISQSKEEILKILQTKPTISTVSPYPYESFNIDQNSVQDIDRLMKAEALDITGPWFNAQLEFDNGVVSSLYLAPVNKGVSFGLTLGQPKEEALSILKVLLRNSQKIRVHNFTPGHPHFDLGTLTSEQRMILLKYDAWVFGESDEFSRMELYFQDGKLERMEYMWSPVEMP